MSLSSVVRVETSVPEVMCRDNWPIDENEYERVNGIYSNDRRSGKGDACVSATGDQCC